jgi:hypothetical protein
MIKISKLHNNNTYTITGIKIHDSICIVYKSRNYILRINKELKCPITRLLIFSKKELPEIRLRGLSIHDSTFKTMNGEERRIRDFF